MVYKGLYTQVVMKILHRHGYEAHTLVGFDGGGLKSLLRGSIALSLGTTGDENTSEYYKLNGTRPLVRWQTILDQKPHT
jgi:hypothetical protein